jgi:hypothetical protein
LETGNIGADAAQATTLYDCTGWPTGASLEQRVAARWQFVLFTLMLPNVACGVRTCIYDHLLSCDCYSRRRIETSGLSGAMLIEEVGSP